MGKNVDEVWLPYVSHIGVDKKFERFKEEVSSWLERAGYTGKNVDEVYISPELRNEASAILDRLIDGGHVDPGLFEVLL